MSKEKEEAEDKFYAIHALCAEYRGTIIHLVVRLENLFDQILTEFFAKEDFDNSVIMQTVLFTSDKFSIKPKYQTVSFIFQRYFPDFADKYNKKSNAKHKKKDANNLDVRVDKIINVRNVLAHTHLQLFKKDIDDFDGETISLNKLIGKDGSFRFKELKETEDKILIFNRKIILEYCREIERLCRIFEELSELIKAQTPTTKQFPL